MLVICTSVESCCFGLGDRCRLGGLGALEALGLEIGSSVLCSLGALEALALEVSSSSLGDLGIFEALGLEIGSSSLGDFGIFEALAVDVSGSGLSREVRRSGLEKAVLRPVQRN